MYSINNDNCNKKIIKNNNSKMYKDYRFELLQKKIMYVQLKKGVNCEK